VTNRALPPNALPGNVGPLPGRGREWLATNDAQPHYGVVTLQVHAFSSDPPPTQVDCQDAAGRRSTPREEVLGVRLVMKAEFENLAAGQPPAFDAKAPFMLFVHGFNVNFGDAVQSIGRLSMQMKHALRPVLFSWPSAGSMWSYGDDGKMAAASPAALTETIETLAKIKPGRPVNLIAHSMGNRVMLDAMDTLRQAARRPAPGILDELISIAPDVQCDRYSAIAGQLQGDADPAKRSFRRATLYLYEKDSALKASKAWWTTTRKSVAWGAGRAAKPPRFEACKWSTGRASTRSSILTATTSATITSPSTCAT
jgi:pimeloyl-ACP methyl ester carboxylesterase